MRIVHLLHEVPWPATSGIRCDMARRVAAFRALGHEVLVVTWVRAGEPIDAIDVQLPIGGSRLAGAWRVLNLLRAPWFAAARIPWPSVTARVAAQVAAFAPDLVWIEGVHAGWLGRKLARRCGVPLVYRAHNIEHRYLAAQARLAHGRQRWALWLGTWGLRREEERVQRAAARVWDISVDDLDWWRARGMAHGQWLAPMAMALPGGEAAFDLLYVGGLNNPANREGVLWFLRAVWPRVRAAIPDAAFVVAGRAPDACLSAAVAAAGARLIADPVDLEGLWAQGRVMVNPVRHGSGVNMKTIDMLASGRAVVTTRVGARGLPGEVAAELHVTDGAEAFAAAVVAAVAAARRGDGGRDRGALMARVFGLGAVAAALAEWETGTVAGPTRAEAVSLPAGVT